MSDIALADSIGYAIITYLCLNLLFTALGSLGLYRVFASRRNKSAALVSGLSFTLVSCIWIGGMVGCIMGRFFEGLPLVLLGTFAFAVSGLTAIALSRKAP